MNRDQVEPRPLARIAAAIHQLESALLELGPVLQPPNVGKTNEEYLSIKELVARVPYEEQTIRNLIFQGELREGVHYLQRRKHGRIVFVWSKVEEWLRDRAPSPSPVMKELDEAEPFYRVSHHARTRKER